MPRILITLAAATVLFGSAMSMAQPRLSNGELRPTTAAGALTRASIQDLAGDRTAWIGYAVPIVAGDHRMCCGSGDQGRCCEGCRLEPAAAAAGTAGPGVTGPVRLEQADSLFVLLRVEDGAITRIRMFSDECPLDAGGLTLYWIGNVPAAESVALLGAFIGAVAPRRVADGALAALAMHREPAALERLAAAARAGSTTHLRGQALFWLAQRAGDQAGGIIAEAVARDPDTEVKRRAVFALSQLPKDEGVPRLIEVARRHANPAVRKQAMFWLGQSKDPRALQFFEEILFR